MTMKQQARRSIVQVNEDIHQNSGFSQPPIIQAEVEVGKKAPSEESSGEASDIDLNASYSDDDYETIPLNEKSLFEYLQKLEDNNLFEMNLLQENQ